MTILSTGLGVRFIENVLKSSSELFVKLVGLRESDGNLVVGVELLLPVLEIL